MRRGTRRTGWLLAGLVLASCGGPDDDEGTDETRTEAIQPARGCMTTEDCPYGRCTTEDGACHPPPVCPPGTDCSRLCHGMCVLSQPAAP